MKTIFRVNQIRSERATVRESLEPRTIEKHIGDFETYEEAKEAYDNTNTGMEVDKELVKLVGNGINDEETIIETTY
jgi:hypothetical protein